MRLLLDTCALLWMSSSPASLSMVAQSAMADADAELFVASISALEIGTKVRNGKLTLPEPLSAWFPRTTATLGLREIPLRSDIAIRATSLAWDHRDPADRILVATATIEDLVIVTADSVIGRFAPARVIW
jgi:PIN domain nuclease of toxin-antitoxin system